MSALSGVTATTLRNGVLAGLLGSGRPLASVADTVLDGAINVAEQEVQSELSTRWKVITFKGDMGPDLLADPGTDTEWEGPYDWPGKLPGDGFPLFTTKVRPVQALLGMTLVYPGGTQRPIPVPKDWFRLDKLSGQALMAPNFFAAPFMASGLPTAILGLTGGRLPMSVLLNYSAGLTPAQLVQYPQIVRLVELRAAMRLLPQFSLMRNPNVLNSQSADGLSQSRASGYIYKDWEERVRAEVDAEKEALLALWDGPSFLVV